MLWRNEQHCFAHPSRQPVLPHDHSVVTGLRPAVEKALVQQVAEDKVAVAVAEVGQRLVEEQAEELVAAGYQEVHTGMLVAWAPTPALKQIPSVTRIPTWRVRRKGQKEGKVYPQDCLRSWICE